MKWVNDIFYCFKMLRYAVFLESLKLIRTQVRGICYNVDNVHHTHYFVVLLKVPMDFLKENQGGKLVLTVEVDSAVIIGPEETAFMIDF